MAPALRLHSSSSTTPRVCTIAGSDSGGGAGIQADLKTFLALGAYGLSVVTALTAQNTRGVTAIHVPPVDFLRAQIKAVRDDIRVDAWKIGMLANAEVIGVVAQELGGVRGESRAPIILDPVMVSTSGSLLLSHDAIHALIEKLLPLCTLLTPNLPEAKQLLAHAQSGNDQVSTSPPSNELKTLQDLLHAARDLCTLGPRAVLIKGGHNSMRRKELESALAQVAHLTQSNTNLEHRIERDGDALSTGAAVSTYQLKETAQSLHCVRADSWPNSVFLEYMFTGADPADDYEVVLDVLYDSHTSTFTCFVKRRIDKSCTHGTGCTLSSALAVHASLCGDGDTLPVDVWKSINYVQATIMRGYEDLGSGPGALDHAAIIQPRGVLSSTAVGLHGVDTTSSDEEITSRYASKLNTSLGPDSTPYTTSLISRSVPLWTSYTWHPFIQRLSQSTGLSSTSLPVQAFTHFLKQDYHFLLHYSRVWSLASSQYSTSFASAQLYNSLASAMANEASSHVSLCEKYFNITRAELESESEGSAVMSYTRFVLDVGRLGELELLTATLPCLLGYAEMGRRLKRARTAEKETHPGLREWLDLYTGEEYTQAVKAGLAHIEMVAERDRPSVMQMEGLQRIWNAAVRLEIALWDESLKWDSGDWRVLDRP